MHDKNIEDTKLMQTTFAQWITERMCAFILFQNSALLLTMLFSIKACKKKMLFSKDILVLFII